MAFSRDDLSAYEAKAQVQDPSHDPWGTSSKELSFEAEPPAAVAPTEESSAEVVTEPTDKGNDGSTTEKPAEPVAATDANPEGDKDTDLGDLADGKPRSRAQERIEELVAERNALRKYGEYLLSQVEATRKAPTQEQPSKAEPTKEVEETPPTLETADFDPIKLNELQNKWIQKQVDARVESAIRQIEVRQSDAAVRQAFEAKTVEFRKTAPDFDTILANPALPKLAPEAARVVVRSENGPAIAYHLGKNPDLAVRISRMDAVDQAAAIGRLEGQIVRTEAEAKEAQKEPSTTKAPVKVASVTKAPPPLKPVSGGTSPVQKDAALMSMEEWVANERNRKIADRTAKQKLRAAMR